MEHNPWYSAFSHGAPSNWVEPWVKWGGGVNGLLVHKNKSTPVKVLKSMAGGPSGALVYIETAGFKQAKNSPSSRDVFIIEGHTDASRRKGYKMNPCPNGCRKDNFGRCTNGRCSNYGKRCNGDCVQRNPYDMGAQAFGRCGNPGLSKTQCPPGTVLTPVVKDGKTQLLCRPKPKGLAKTPCPAGTVLTPVVKDGKTQLLCRPKQENTLARPRVYFKVQQSPTSYNPRQPNPGCPTCPGYAEAQKAWNWYRHRHPRFGKMWNPGRTVIAL